MKLNQLAPLGGFVALGSFCSLSTSRSRLCAARSSILAAASLMVGAFQIQADTLSLPGTASGNTQDTQSIFSTSAVTYQFLISHSQLVDLGSSANITGISFRLRNNVTTTQPTADMDFDDFEIYMGPMASSFGSLNGTFADNLPEDSSRIQVKDGSFTLSANSLNPRVTVGDAGPYGATITFPAYEYSSAEGNGLVIEIRHSIGTTTGSTPALDAIFNTSGHGSSASGSLYAYRSTASMSATSGNGAGFVSIQLAYTPVPEPSEYAAAAGIGLLAFAAWRRTRRQANVVSA